MFRCYPMSPTYLISTTSYTRSPIDPDYTVYLAPSQRSPCVISISRGTGLSPSNYAGLVPWHITEQ